MSGALIAQLLISLGPVALELIPKLSTIWSTEQTPEQVRALLEPAKKSYDSYISAARAQLTVL